METNNNPAVEIEVLERFHTMMSDIKETFHTEAQTYLDPEKDYGFEMTPNIAEAIRDASIRASEVAFAEGYEAGFERGCTEGYSEGMEKGYEEGYEKAAEEADDE